MTGRDMRYAKIFRCVAMSRIRSNNVQCRMSKVQCPLPQLSVLINNEVGQKQTSRQDRLWTLDIGHVFKMSSTVNIPPQFEVVDRPLDTQMTISMGPQHPSTHGVLRLELVLDGEMVVKATPDIGYLHTGMEKLFEYKKYQQGIVITDRMDYLNPLGNNLAYVMAVEKLLELEIPERAQTIRVLMCELQRIASHLVWLGTHALDIGAMSVFFYCFREREKVMNLIEAAS